MSRVYIPKALREQVAAQAKYRCGYCLTQENVVGTLMEFEHLIPLALGGETVLENLWLACSQCNDTKNDRITALDPLTGETVNLYNPRQQRWIEHFQWTAEGDFIVGITSVGRATISALNLNRLPLIKARLRWVEVGWHPPKE